MALWGAGDRVTARWDRSAADHAHLYAISSLRPAGLVISVFFVPLFGLLPVYGTDRLRGAILAILLQASLHNVLFAAHGAVVNAAQGPPCPGLALGGIAYPLPLRPTSRAIPGPRAAVKGDAALAADPWAKGSGADGGDAVLTFCLTLAGLEQLAADDAFFKPHDDHTKYSATWQS